MPNGGVKNLTLETSTEPSLLLKIAWIKVATSLSEGVASGLKWRFRQTITTEMQPYGPTDWLATSRKDHLDAFIILTGTSTILVPLYWRMPPILGFKLRVDLTRLWC